MMKIRVYTVMSSVNSIDSPMIQTSYTISVSSVKTSVITPLLILVTPFV